MKNRDERVENRNPLTVGSQSRMRALPVSETHTHTHTHTHRERERGGAGGMEYAVTKQRYSAAG